MSSPFNIDNTISQARKFLVPQGPLKEFIAQNPLQGFLHIDFHEALRRASSTWGAWSYLSLGFYRAAYEDGEISKNALERSLHWNIEDKAARERTRSDLFEYPEGASRKPMSLALMGIRSKWTQLSGSNISEKSSAILYRLLGSYLDQGIAIWRMPESAPTFFAAVVDMVSSSRIPYPPFNQPLARKLLVLPSDEVIKIALAQLAGSDELAERYVYEILMTAPGWSSTVDFIERNPESLLLKKNISLKELIAVSLILDVAFLEMSLGSSFKSLASQGVDSYDLPMFTNKPISRVDFIKLIWHEAWEWSFYESSLSLICKLRKQTRLGQPSHIQALFCIDDRESSLRSYLEDESPAIATYGLPGFFGIDFMYQCASDVSPARLAPIVLKPRHLVTAKFDQNLKRRRPSRAEQLSLGHHSHTIFRGWLLTQVLGLTAAVRLAISIFRPSMNLATASAMSRVNEHITMELDRSPETGVAEDGYLHGFTPAEMAQKIAVQLEAIGLVKEFAPLVVLLAHGSSSTNNTHFSAYDCGACSGKPGSPNARAFAKMANRSDVRGELSKIGIHIPASTEFVAALHDTTRDEVKFFDLRDLNSETRARINEFKDLMNRALARNAQERCRRFELVDPKISETSAVMEVRKRSAAIFEPRPELTHTGNALAIVGRRSLTERGFWDRRAFLHSYDPTLDAHGKRLRGILSAVIPVCGGINLNYYFSKLDNEVYGASSKLPHNIIGLIGVCSGVEGDIQTGLPRQMIELHDPIRLQLIIEQKPNIVLDILESEPSLQLWIRNNWMRLMCIDPQSGEINVYREGIFVAISESSLPDISHMPTYRSCYEGKVGNCPLAIVGHGGTHHGH